MEKTPGDKDSDEVSRDLTIYSLRMGGWDRKSFGRILPCIWLHRIETEPIVASWNLDPSLVKHMCSGSIGLAVNWCQGTTSASMFLTFPHGGKMMQLNASWSYVNTFRQRRGGQEEMCFSLHASFIGSKIFPWTPWRSSLITDLKWATCPSLPQSPPNENSLP